MNMKRGLTMVELAVALALLGVLALALALLLGQMGRGSQRAQAEAQLQADLQEVRARLTEDVLLSTGISCTPTGANLTLPSGSVAYSFSGGQLLRNGVALTLQGGYGGSFSCDGRTLTLDLTWEGAPVATIAATRRVGLVVAGDVVDESDFPMNLEEVQYHARKNRISEVRWTNDSGRPLYLLGVSVLNPVEQTIERIRMRIRGSSRFLDERDGEVPVTYPVGVVEVSHGAVVELERLEFSDSIEDLVVQLEFRFCLTNSSSCPPDQEVSLTYAFVCTRAGCEAR